MVLDFFGFLQWRSEGGSRSSRKAMTSLDQSAPRSKRESEKQRFFSTFSFYSFLHEKFLSDLDLEVTWPEKPAQTVLTLAILVREKYPREIWPSRTPRTLLILRFFLIQNHNFFEIDYLISEKVYRDKTLQMNIFKCKVFYASWVQYKINSLLTS